MKYVSASFGAGYTKCPSFNIAPELSKHPIVIYHFGDERSIWERVVELLDEMEHAGVVIAIHVCHDLDQTCTQWDIHIRFS